MKDVSSLAPADFKRAMRRLAGTVGIIAAEHEGRRCGMAATSITSLAMDPPSLLVCVNRGASLHPLLTRSGWFSVSLLHESQATVCADFGGGYDQAERFARSDWGSGLHGIPFLVGAQANFFCRAAAANDFASHTIFIGEVLHVQYQEAVAPLLYVDGRCTTLAAAPA